MATTPETPVADTTITEGGRRGSTTPAQPTPVMPYAADFAISPLLEPRPEEGAHDRTMVLNMGPQHPSTHGVLRLVLEIDGETVLRVVPDIGFLHTGIEKTCEAKFYQQVVPLTDRIDYLCPMTNNLCYCLAVEKLLQLEIPPRAQYLRVLLNELTRLQSHLVWLGTHAMDIGALTVFLYCFREREELLKIFEHVSGQRMMTSYFRVGGIALEPPVDFYERVQKLLNIMPSKIDEYQNLLTGNPIWISRTKGVGHLSAEDAIALGVTGPPLRASGVDWDLRRDMPYSGYEKFQFKVPVSNDCDVWARYVVRMEEMRESVKICQQALDGMPEGPIKADAPKVVLPDRESDEDPDGSRSSITSRLSPRVSRCRQARSTRRSSRRAARWATTSSAMARRSPIACTCATLRSRPCRRWRRCAPAGCWPMWSRSSARSTSCWGRLTDECTLPWRDPIDAQPSRGSCGLPSSRFSAAIQRRTD